jgi:hypothetical protein
VTDQKTDQKRAEVVRAGPEDDEAVQAKHPSVPDVRGPGPHPATEPQYQPPKEHLGVNPTNQFEPDPTPTAQADRSVPDAPVVGGLPREPGRGGGASAQYTARERGAAWPPIQEGEPPPLEALPAGQAQRESARK